MIHLVALFVAIDALLTIYMLASGGMHEANPLLSPLIERYGATPTLLVTHAAFIGALYRWPVPPLALYPMLAIWAGAAVWNVGQIIKRNRLRR